MDIVLIVFNEFKPRLQRILVESLISCQEIAFIVWTSLQTIVMAIGRFIIHEIPYHYIDVKHVHRFISYVSSLSTFSSKYSLK